MLTARRLHRLLGQLLIAGGLAACASEAPTALPLPAELGVMAVAVTPAGVPTLLHATGHATLARATPTASAIAHVEQLAPVWGVRGAMPDLVAMGEVPVAGGTIVRLAQELDGVRIERAELRVFVRATGELVAVSGSLRDPATALGSMASSARGAVAATPASMIARAVQRTYGIPFPAAALAPLTPAAARGATDQWEGASADVVVERARAVRVWAEQGGALVPAWRVEAFTAHAGSRDAHRTVLADDGRVMEHASIVAAEAFSYRVWADAAGDKRPADGPIADFSPHPTGVPDHSFPPYVAPSLVSVDGLNHPAGGAGPDPWLPATATETLGNNIDAYVDHDDIDGLSAGDFRASVTAPRTFDHTYDLMAAPLATRTQQEASIVQLFYTMNWLHDFWYDAGFTEAAGNGQTDNYGRGGAGGDAVHVEAQDNASNPDTRNNANMATPQDGMSPRMQVFLWSGRDDRTLTLVPGGMPDVGAAAFGPPDFDVTGTVVFANDGTAPVRDACTALPATVAGKIVLADRGGCQYETKAATAQAAGAIGLIVADNVASAAPPAMGNGDNTTPITIATLSVTQAAGAAITAGATATLHRRSGVELDGALDSTTVAHEFGHYLHHRLTQCGNAICGAMSEGWGDFDSLLLIARAGDNLDGAFPFSIYDTQGISPDPGYFGIRRVPYSVDPTKDPLTFKHMAEGEPLPTTAPILAKNNNSEIHNAGEVWASMLWEGYVALQKAGTSFDDTRMKMARYVVAGLLLTPPDGTITEARDAILEAVKAASPADHALLTEAFARRGFGTCAVPPPADSRDFTGIVESTENKGRVVPMGAMVADSVVSCDKDGILDANETATVTAMVTNPGPQDVTDVTLQLTTDVEGMTVLTAPVHVDRFAAYTSMPFEAQVKLGAVTGAKSGTLAIEVRAADACTTLLTTSIASRFNLDDSPKTAAEDTFDAVSIWTTAPAGTWTQVRVLPLDGYWALKGTGVASDSVLVSPEVTVGDGNLTMTFDHKFQFETNMNAAYDGGVIEYSADGGQTWADVADISNLAYPGMLAESENPLKLRPAFTAQNLAYPDRDTVTVTFGKQLAKKTVRFRFRFGSDSGTASEGWQVDNFKLDGIVGKPFPSQVGDNGDCSGGPTQPSTDDGGCCQSSAPSAPLLPVLGALGFVLTLRRRKRPTAR